jgi:hypothetical protein
MVFAVAIVAILAGGQAKAYEDSRPSYNGYRFGLALTLGEGMYFFHYGDYHDVYRGPVSLEVVPSYGWGWFKVDLGLYMTLESIRIAGGNVGNWNFTFRPGGRVTSPWFPLYFRFAFPLQLQLHHFDFGIMFGLGLDIHIVGNLGFVFEVDTTLSKYLEWGGDGVPLEFRGGVSFHF